MAHVCSPGSEETEKQGLGVMVCVCHLSSVRGKGWCHGAYLQSQFYERQGLVSWCVSAIPVLERMRGRRTIHFSLLRTEVSRGVGDYLC